MYNIKVDSRNWSLRIAIVAVIMVVVSVAYIFSLVNQFRIGNNDSRLQIENGNIIVVIQNRTHHIYAEDSSPLAAFRHDFIFTDVGSGQRFYSTAPTTNFSYSMNTVRVNNVYTRGTFGVRIASVHLDIGEYIVEFDPLQGNEVVVWDFSFLSDFLPNILRMLLLTLIWFACIAALVVCVVKKVKQRDARKHAELMSKRD